MDIQNIKLIFIAIISSRLAGDFTFPSDRKSKQINVAYTFFPRHRFHIITYFFDRKRKAG